MSAFPLQRCRRLRQHSGLRSLVRETRLHLEQLVHPLFIHEALSGKRAINSMPGQFQFGLDALAEEIRELERLQVSTVLLFGIPAEKDATGSSILQPDNIINQALNIIKSTAPGMLVITDVCCCEYTDHGHCGPLYETTQGTLDVHNDHTLDLLAQQAVVLAQAGADVIAPSASMDGMVQAIRTALDSAGFTHIPIMSYAVKYSSAFYGPFRDAAESPPQFGDRSTYQMDPCNGAEALREAALDIAEGTDFLMVKPAMMYLDVLYRLKQQWPEYPLVAYQVSGEYSMLKLAAQQGLFSDERRLIEESLLSIKRAGADIIISYFTKQYAQYLACVEHCS